MKTNNDKKFLKTLSKAEIEEALNYQIKNSYWNFYDERVFIENLFSTKFSYLLLIYSIFITAVIALKDKSERLIILYIGLVFVTFLSLSVYRLYIKLIIILRILHDLPDKHVFSIVKKEVKLWKIRMFEQNQIFGYIIPLLLILSIILAIIMLHIGIWITK